jgi:hypothetical protein
MGRVQEAEGELRKILAIDPGHSEAVELMAKIEAKLQPAGNPQP